MKLHHYALCLSIICLPACTWVETTKEGKEVTLVKEFNVKDCLKLGTINASVTHKVGILIREDEAVTEDLVVLAKNRAAEYGGDSIVSKGPAVEGKMSFDIYSCSN
ncbi:MAG: DUF4156 domain-containing protein [Gammaproteobacteria bacterium]|nr:DUF4156 domain-containing protein [Gammaproteobacteria bacterium]